MGQNYLNNFGEHYPRKGTETFADFGGIDILIITSESIIPVRGLKLTTILVPNIIRSSVFGEHYPRKGTETYLLLFTGCWKFGAGFGEHYPRKGTETIFSYRK